MGRNGLAIEVLGLSRSFRSGTTTVQALRDVSFSVQTGSCVGVLGVNGAGKTTLLKILSGLLTPSGGDARIQGHSVVADPRAARRAVAVVLGGERGLYPRLTGVQNLRFLSMLDGISGAVFRRRHGAVLESVGLAPDVARRRVETYSRGQKQRVHLAAGLLSAAPVLLLDEPTIGLDPVEAHRMRQAIAQLGDAGTTVLLTSHYAVDVEALCERVVLISNGAVTVDLPTEEFLRTAGHVAVLTVTGAGIPSAAVEAVARREDAHLTRDELGWRLSCRIAAWDAAGADLLAGTLASAGADAREVSLATPSLDEAFRLRVRDEAPDVR